MRTAQPLPAIRAAQTAALVLAASAPSLLAYNVSPSPTFLNQALALGAWGGLAALLALTSPARLGRGIWPALAALFVLGGAAAVSWGLGGLPSSLALSAIALLLATAVLLASGASTRAGANAADLFALFCWAWLIAGVLNAAVALVQVFAPGWADGRWIAVTSIPGRAVGNLRQPNHLSSLLLWACIAVLALADMGRLRQRVVLALLALMVWALVLTASRTGLLSVLLLALWGLLDKRLARRTRALLLATPLLYALAWLGMSQWAALSAHRFGGAARLAETDISGSRFGIWANTLVLIRQQPWLGVGFGEFNFAWTLTPFPGRPTAFFDHTHNLPLQLAVELGVPLATLVMGLLVWALWRAARSAFGRQDASTGAPTDPANTAQRAALMMVLMIVLHSLLEYPLWYAYFLLPAAWVLGFALGHTGRDEPVLAAPTAPAWPLALAGLLVLLGAVFSVWDYKRVAVIFWANAGRISLAERIEAGQRSVFFAHHADYAAVTSGVTPGNAQPAFDRATHYLLDSRLMTAWARHLSATGQVEKAQHVAQQLREFGKADTAAFFDPCLAPAAPISSLPFQCSEPTQATPWRAFLRH